MRFGRVVHWLERLAANAKVTTFLGSFPASTDTGDSDGAADEAVLYKVHEQNKKNSPVSSRVSDPDWIRIQSGQWIRIWIRNPDPGGQK